MTTSQRSSQSGNGEIPVLSIASLSDDPHGICRNFRGSVPFIRSEVGVYLVLRANDVLNLYSETMTRQVETEFLALRGVKVGPFWDFMSNGMLTSNGDAHRRRRSPMARTFGFRMIDALRPHIKKTVSDILEQNIHAGGMDVLNDLASLIPSKVIASILGLPQEDINHAGCGLASLPSNA